MAQRLLVWKPNAISILEGLPHPQAFPAASSVPASKSTWSTDGSLLALVTEGAVSILDGKTLQQVQRFDLPGVVAAAFSPHATFLQTFQQPTKDAGNSPKNLKLLHVKTGEVAMQLYQKTMSKESWPCLRLSADEAVACHLVTNAVNVYSTSNFAAGVQKKLPLKGVGGFGISPTIASQAKLAAWAPEARGSPGFVGIWDLQALGKGDVPNPLSRRTFFRDNRIYLGANSTPCKCRHLRPGKANSVTLLWNATGSSLLATTSSDVDATNQSYYGEQKLHFLAADGSNDCLVPELKDGPIHDAQWSPDGQFFVVIAGFMPAKTILFDDKCKPLSDMGAGPHNIVRWNPHSRFFAVCGFGNLPGDVVFYDKKVDGKCKIMGSTRANNGVTCEWAPDGRHFLTATLAPRLRVDNGIQIFRYTAALVHQQRMDILLGACWQPAPEGEFPDRPQSPRAGGGAAAADGSAGTPPPARAAGYVPPHQRGQGNAAPAPSFSLAYEQGGVGKLLKEAQGGRLVPGQAPPKTGAASKNARRNAARKKKKEGSTAGDDGEEDQAQPSTVASEPAAVNGHSTDAVTSGLAAAFLEQPAGSASQSQADNSEDATAKKVKALHKKLRQIQQMKEKGGELHPEQLRKIAQEEEICAELHSFGEHI